MTLKECYGLVGSYDDVIGRLRSERLVQKFVLKFLDDPSYGNLHKALEEGDAKEAFRASHTIKGICQNLGFQRLQRSSHDLTEALRDGGNDHVEELLQKVDEDYQFTAAAVKEFKESNGL